jgi:hypothetical protein
VNSAYGREAKTIVEPIHPKAFRPAPTPRRLSGAGFNYGADYDPQNKTRHRCLRFALCDSPAVPPHVRARTAG